MQKPISNSNSPCQDCSLYLPVDSGVPLVKSTDGPNQSRNIWRVQPEVAKKPMKNEVVGMYVYKINLMLKVTSTYMHIYIHDLIVMACQ